MDRSLGSEIEGGIDYLIKQQRIEEFGYLGDPFLEPAFSDGYDLGMSLKRELRTLAEAEALKKEALEKLPQKEADAFLDGYLDAIGAGPRIPKIGTIPRVHHRPL